jgi:hypothetical protein
LIGVISKIIFKKLKKYIILIHLKEKNISKNIKNHILKNTPFNESIHIAPQVQELLRILAVAQT